MTGVPVPGPSSAQSMPSNRGPSVYRAVFTLLRRSAWSYAAYFGGLASTVFFGATFVGIVEGVDYVWMISLPIVVVLALGAIVSSAVACWDSVQQEQHLPTILP